MIWLKHGEKLLGFVPTLKKEYSEDEIKKMSNNTSSMISSLSEFVMQIQGITAEFYEEGRTIKKISENSLVEVSLNLRRWECFNAASNPTKTQNYVEDIFDVFGNITLHKFVELGIKDVKETINFLAKEVNTFNEVFNYLLEVEVESQLNIQLEKNIQIAESNAECLELLMQLFLETGKILEKDKLFDQNPDEETKKKLTEERTSKYSIFFGAW